MKEQSKETKSPANRHTLLLKLGGATVVFFLGLGLGQFPGLEFPSMASAKDQPTLKPLMPGRAERDILLALEAKREKIESMSEELTRREAYIQEAEERLAKQVQSMEGMRTEITKLLSDKNVFREQKFKDLAKIHAEMPISKSAAIITKMDDDIAVKVLLNLKRDRIAKVLAKMDPKRAYSINREILGLKKKQSNKG